MNWTNLKEKYPLAHDEIKETAPENIDAYSSRFLIEDYIKSKGQTVYFPFTKNLDEIEKSLSEKTAIVN